MNHFLIQRTIFIKSLFMFQRMEILVLLKLLRSEQWQVFTPENRIAKCIIPVKFEFHISHTFLEVCSKYCKRYTKKYSFFKNFIRNLNLTLKLSGIAIRYIYS